MTYTIFLRGNQSHAEGTASYHSSVRKIRKTSQANLNLLEGHQLATGEAAQMEPELT